MSNGEMSQEDIDKLLKGVSGESSDINNEEATQEGTEKKEVASENDDKKDEFEKSQVELIEEEKKKQKKKKYNLLTKQEKDVIGELANISFGSASTALSSLLSRKVSITAPVVEEMNESELGESDSKYVVLNVDFIKGLEMENVFVIKKEVALFISDIMMGIEEHDTEKELEGMGLSALEEAMNQMMGMAATAMSEVFKQHIDITPPNIKTIGISDAIDGVKDKEKKVVRISFELNIGEEIKSNLYQIVSIENAKKMAKQLLEVMNGGEIKPAVENKKTKEKQGEKGKEKSRGDRESSNDLIKDISVKLDLVYGRTKTTLKDFLSLEQNHVIELNEEIDEPLKMYANGVLVAEGELLNVEGYYGLKVTKVY